MFDILPEPSRPKTNVGVPADPVMIAVPCTSSVAFGVLVPIPR